jgi:hypothetical protein
MNQNYEILFSLAIIVLIFYNQVRVRQVKSDTRFVLPLIMLVLGVINFKNYMATNELTVIAWISIITSFTLLAFGMAAVRATTVKLWTDNSVIYRQGTWITIVLWVISVALHAVLNQIGHVGQSTSLIYFAITFSVQKLIVQKRARVFY